MQISIKSDLKIGPDFMRYSIGAKEGSPSSLPKYKGAFVEGWGLYSEYLGYELGIYDNEPLKEIGYLMSDLLR